MKVTTPLLAVAVAFVTAPPLFTVAVTVVELSDATTFPEPSCNCRIGCVTNTAPATPPTGCRVITNCDAAPAWVVIVGDVPVIDPVVAVTVRAVPATVDAVSVTVATPLAFVFDVVAENDWPAADAEADHDTT